MPRVFPFQLPVTGDRLSSIWLRWSKPLRLVFLALGAASMLLLSRLPQADWQQWVPTALIAKAELEYGRDAADRIRDWQFMMRDIVSVDEQEKLRRVNDFFNRYVRFVNDDKHWGQEDYWATPYEILGSNGADCEDYVIAKYYSLRQLGVDTSKLRITYVKALRYNQAHMVLTYFPTPDAIPVVLDNINKRIRPASERTDLAPVYSFNADGMWLEKMKGRGIRMGNPNKLDLWTDLRVRMNNLGMDL